MIKIIPAIDVIQGRCVRLSRGDYSSSRVYGDPLEMAKVFADAGATMLHLVDLDGAKSSEPCNLRVLESIAALGSLKIEWGGGLKTRDALSHIFDAGADYAIVGSLAAMEPETFESWIAEFGPDRMVMGADILDGQIRVNGWLQGVTAGLFELVSRFAAAGLSRVICTDISRDGMLGGPNTDLYRDLQNHFANVVFTVSGGVSSMGDIRELDACRLREVIVGKALYEGRITIGELESCWRNG